MYKVEILPVAQKDMINTVSYISIDLANPEAASELADVFSKKSTRWQGIHT